MPADVLFSGPQRCVMRKMQLLAVPLPEQIVHYRATADAAGDADRQVFIQPERAHIKSIVVQRAQRQTVVYHTWPTVGFPVDMSCFNTNQRTIQP